MKSGEAPLALPPDIAIRVRAQNPTATHVALYECHMLDSSRLGDRTWCALGPFNTWTVETAPAIMSPRGLASDTAVKLAVFELP